jgi:signal transduction histidine kinase/CheY-like chemotaxis protein
MDTPSAPAPSSEALAAEVARLRAELAARDAEVLSLQAALNERDSIISGFNDHVPGGLLMLDRAPDGRRVIPVASQGLATLFDLDPALLNQPEPLFHAIIERLHPEDRPKIAALEAEANAGRSQLMGEFRVQRRDGAPCWVWLQLGLQRTEQGHRIWYGVIQDITERKQLARRLEARDAMLKSLSRNLPGVLFKLLVSPQGDTDLAYISEGARRLYELEDIPPQQLTWASHYQRIHPDDLPEVQRLSQLVCEQPGELHRYEYRVILPQKGLRWMAGQSIGQPEGPEGTTAWYGYVQDVTEQKLYADAVISAEAAQRANEAKSEFLSRMSHELRTPLNAVIGFAQLLQMDRSGLFGAEQRSRVQLIEKAGKHLLAMLGDVLDLSRIEAGDLPLSIEPVDVTAVVDETLNLVAPQAQQAGVRLDASALPPHLHVQADRVRLRQVLVNLLSNAIKYNRPGGEVRLSGGLEADQVRLQVQDTGIGMRPEQLAQLFVPFNRLGAERTAVEGTGIGLVIVQRLLTLMQGHLNVHSEPGQGSTFGVHLPQADDLPEPSDHQPLQALESSSPNSATILYAEDNEVNVMLVHEVLKLRPHWRLVVATSGERALTLAQRQRPDLLLIDMHLGDMSGLDLADALDRVETLRDVPRVALSADAMPDRIHTAKARGFKAYLTKPLDVLALLRCLDEVLSQRSST